MSFFLGNKKRDLIVKSRKGKTQRRWKKILEVLDEVFRDGLNSPECVKILVKHLWNIEGHVRELFVLNEETINVQIKLSSWILKFFSNKFNELERENKKKNKNKEFEETIDVLTEKNKSLTNDVDELEQYFRRNSLSLHRVQEN